MATPSAGSDHTTSTRFRARLREALLTGVALTIPLIVTLFVLAFVLNFVANTLDVVVDVATAMLGVGETVERAVLQAVTALALLACILLIGFVAEARQDGHIEEAFDDAMERIPGVGAVYTSFNEMSEILLRNDTQSFREVYLVEYPTEGSFALAFLTADTPAFVEEVTGNDEMVTLFMPMAPNPVMGGFVVHVAADRVYDVDMTVEEGIESIVTSGVAIAEHREDHSAGDTGLSPAELADLADRRVKERQRETGGPGDSPSPNGRDGVDHDGTDGSR